MDEAFESVSVRVMADTTAFRREIGDLKAAMARDLGDGAALAGRGIEAALSRAARTGRLELEDLARTAARVLGEIAARAIAGPAAPTASAPAGGLGAILGGLVGGLLGLPGRSTGGPVAPGRAYVVGERGPELFVPTASGRVEPAMRAGRGPVTVNVRVAVPTEASEAFMSRTATQLARAVRRSLERLED